MAIYNGTIFLTRGDSDSITVSCTNEDGSLKPLTTGDKVYLTVKSVMGTTDKLFQKVETSFTEGVAVILLNASDTKNIKPGDYFFDIRIIWGSGGVDTLVRPERVSKGKYNPNFFLLEDVTHE